MKESGKRSLRVLACELFPLGCVLWKCRAWLHLVDPSLTGPVSALSQSLHCVCPLYRDWTTATSHNNELQRVLEVSEKSHAVIQERCASLLKQHSPHWKKNQNTGIRMSARCLSWMINCLQPQTVLDWLIKRLVLWKLNALWTLFGNFESRALNHISRQELLEYLFLLQLVTKSNHKMCLWYKIRRLKCAEANQLFTALKMVIFAFILQESPKPHPPHGHYIHGDVGKLKFFFFSCGSKMISHFKHAYIEFGGIRLDFTLERPINAYSVFS